MRVEDENSVADKYLVNPDICETYSKKLLLAISARVRYINKCHRVCLGIRALAPINLFIYLTLDSPLQ